MKTFKTLLLLLISSALYSQNVGINTTGTIPSSNAILDINTGNANNTGFIPPSVVLGASLATFNPPIINAPTINDVGMIVFNKNAANQPIGFYYWNGAVWVGMDNLDTYSQNYIVNGAVGGNAGCYALTAAFTTIVSITVPSGTYCVTATCETGGQCSAGSYIELTDGITADVETPYINYNYLQVYGWYPCSFMREETVAVATTFSLMGENSLACGGTVITAPQYVRNAHIEAIRVK